MPLGFARSNQAKSLIQETKERVKGEISSMNEADLKIHLEQLKSDYESTKLLGDGSSKIIYHELAVVRNQYGRKVDARNAKLAKQFLKLLQSKKINCVHCAKRIHLDML
jgi:hypothetical protein